MKAEEVFNYLVDQGCNPASFRVGTRGGSSDVFCLNKGGAGEWYVCYSERGIESDAEFCTDKEDKAVEYFRKKILSQKHLHCVGFFSKEPNASELQNRLEARGLEVETDKIPFGGPDDPRYRVFVVGTAIFAAKELLGDPLPKTDL